MLLDQTIFYDLIVLLLHDHTETVRSICLDFINMYRDNETKLLEQERNIIALYVKILEEIMDNGLSLEKNKNEVIVLLDKYKLDSTVSGNPNIQKSIDNIINIASSDKTIEAVRIRLNNILLWMKLSQNVSKVRYYLTKFKNTSDAEKRKQYLNLVNSYIDNLNVIRSTNYLAMDNIKGVESIDFSNKESILQAVKRYKEIELSNLVRFGLKGLNQMNHPINGFPLGTSIVFGALSGNFKSNMLLNVVRWLIEYNDFSKICDNPLVLYISLENKASVSTLHLFKRFYYSQHKDDPDVLEKIDRMSEEEIASYLYGYIIQKNIGLVIERYRPHEFNYVDLISLYQKYENAGYTVIALVVDYLALMNLSASSSGFTGSVSTQSLFDRVCNFCRDKNTLFVTAHQLSDRAAVIAQEVVNPVVKFNESCLALSKGIQRELDFLIFMHLLRTPKGTYLTMKLHKNRYSDEIPKRYEFVAYPLIPKIGLIDDINTKFGGIRNIDSILKDTETESATEDFGW